MEYIVQRVGGAAEEGCSWDRGAWADIEPLELSCFMGSEPKHRPLTRAKLLYDHSCVHVRFRVEDRYVLAAASRHQDNVCSDSCVELFFAPEDRLDHGYFNVEVNCGGTVLLHHQLARQTQDVAVDPAFIHRMAVRSSLPRRTPPELSHPLVWTVGYRIPFRSLRRYAPVTVPEPGVGWRANLYKCADDSSHPHWLTWAHVDNPTPDFHLREFFGTLRFA